MTTRDIVATFKEMYDADVSPNLISHITNRVIEWQARPLGVVYSIVYLDCLVVKIRPMFAYVGSGKSLFLANNGKRYVPGKLSDMASKYVKLAGFERTRACHIYRHNTATTMLDNGADLRYIQEVLGHASILTTQLYTHVSRKKLTQVYNDMHPSAQGGSGLF